MRIKTVRIRPVLFLCGLALFAASAVILYRAAALPASRTEDAAADPVSFLASLGLQADPASEIRGTVRVPLSFDGAFGEYNALQLAQGCDLLPYRGKTLEKRSFRILNYPGYEGAEDITANLLFFEGAFVGGDICAARLDGFLHGLLKEEYGKTQTG